MATDQALLSQYTSGQITYAAYTAAVKAQEQAAHTAAAIAALHAAKNVSPTLIASEVALQRASLARQQQEAARAAQAAAAKAAQAAALKAQQAKVDAARRSKNAAAAAAAQAELRRQQQAAAAARAAAVKAEQARRHAEEQRVAQLAEQARQKMIAETGRVVAPEQEGAVVAAAMTKATAEQDLAAGNYNGVSVYLANQAAPEYKPLGTPGIETGIPYVKSGSNRSVIDREAQLRAAYAPPPTDHVPVSDTAVTSPAAATPTVATDLGTPSDAWNDAADTTYAPVVGAAQQKPPAAQNPYLYMTDQQKAKQQLGQHVGMSLLIGGIGLLLTGVWIQT